MVGLARLLVHIFFRRVEVEHGERIGTDQPTVVVINHRNGLVDGLLLMAALGRYPRFLGKSTLFHNPLLWPFLKLAGVIPVYPIPGRGVDLEEPPYLRRRPPSPGPG
jgi:glycerol-3-phosphate O-acyltransferase/dihydroxyacetone phosphate acyltransferase